MLGERRKAMSDRSLLRPRSIGSGAPIGHAVASPLGEAACADASAAAARTPESGGSTFGASGGDKGDTGGGGRKGDTEGGEHALGGGRRDIGGGVEDTAGAERVGDTGGWGRGKDTDGPVTSPVVRPARGGLPTTDGPVVLSREDGDSDGDLLAARPARSEQMMTLGLCLPLRRDPTGDSGHGHGVPHSTQPAEQPQTNTHGTVRRTSALAQREQPQTHTHDTVRQTSAIPQRRGASGSPDSVKGHDLSLGQDVADDDACASEEGSPPHYNSPHARQAHDPTPRAQTCSPSDPSVKQTDGSPFLQKHPPVHSPAPPTGIVSGPATNTAGGVRARKSVLQRHGSGAAPSLQRRMQAASAIHCASPTTGRSGSAKVSMMYSYTVYI